MCVSFEVEQRLLTFFVPSVKRRPFCEDERLEGPLPFASSLHTFLKICIAKERESRKCALEVFKNRWPLFDIRTFVLVHVVQRTVHVKRSIEQILSFIWVRCTSVLRLSGYKA